MQAPYKGNIYSLVRHGEAENNVLGLLNSGTGKREYPLTDRGREQVAKTAEFLKSEAVDFIVSSPVLRAHQTAEILKDTLGVPLSIDPRLCEAGFGSFEETSHQAFVEFMATHGTRAVGAPELGVEGYMDIRERVRFFLQTTRAAFSGKNIVIVSHADTLQEMYAELIGEPIGSEQGDGRWFPEKASCLVVTETGVRSYNPAVID
ncbi:MAG: histidine phosphatase family protein [Undibacterium sp.]